MNNPKCIALASIGAVVNCVDTDNRAGIVDRIIFGYADDVKVWPNLPAPTGGAAPAINVQNANLTVSRIA